MPITVPTITQGIDWSELRGKLKDCIKVVAPTAVVYKSWPLKYDIPETIRLLQSEAYDNLVHAWMISINRAEPYLDKVGGSNLKWKLNIRVWGFVGYQQDHDDTTQDVMESECRAISQVLYMNRKNLGLSDAEALKELGLITWEDIDVHAFGDGNDVHVAQGDLEVVLSEVFNA